MSPELKNTLRERWPKLLAHAEISCGDGWFDLIDALCERLQFSTDRNGVPQAELGQVKEKFGRLCVNRVGPRSEIHDGMIDMASSMSERICETCGSRGRLVVDGFCHVTRCATHMPEEAVSVEEHLKLRKGLGIAP